MLTLTAPESYAAIAETLAALDLTPALGDIRAPTLVVCGAEDEAIPMEHGERLARALGSATLMVVSGAAHLLTAERPDAVAAALLEHIARAEAS